MFKKNHKIIILMLVVMALSITSFAGGWDVSSASSWAQPEIEEAYYYDLMPYKLMSSNLKDKITRAEFASLVVKMYETITGEVVKQAPIDTFDDTDDIDVLKANALGIMLGSNKQAKPNELVTRQQMAVMYYRTLSEVYNFFGEEMKSTDEVLTINDKNLIANWALKAVDYINENNIMKGSNGSFNPTDNAPIEQAVIVIKRIYSDEKDLKEGTRNIDLSKGYTYKADAYGENFTITYNANNKTKTIKAGDNSVLGVYANDANNSKIYYKVVNKNSNDATGTNSYSYDVATNKSISLDEYFGYEVSTIALINSGTYKGNILVYPYEDTVSVYTKELELVCTLEGMVTAENANVMIDNKLNPPTATMEFENRLLYGNNKGDATSTKYFNFYGESESKIIQQQVLGLNPCSTMNDIKTGNGPVLLACDSNGDNYQLDISMRTVVCRFQVKTTNTYADSANAGIVLGVRKPGTGNDQYYGYYIGIAPKNKTVIIGRSNNKWNGLLSANIPDYIDPYDCRVKVTVKTSYMFGSSMYNLTVALEGEKEDAVVINNKYLGSTSGSHTSYGAKYIPGFSGAFGIRSYKSDVEFPYFEITRK
ncbi:S-layer homology domain-containing protein [Vallitalea sp.]|uniref:S-layer homology domain-containing protein n=1 Tax=Vallitalea sp. TaxID=1882829 RepID=UPI0025EC012B|nr:S-layer homology domain-containing protein [Vallitalea sp.]MCT4686116.1 hypothetical protein [Vallitalea sp.]